MAEREKEHSAAGRSCLQGPQERETLKGCTRVRVSRQSSEGCWDPGGTAGAGRAGQRRRTLVIRVTGRVVSTGQGILS